MCMRAMGAISLLVSYFPSKTFTSVTRSLRSSTASYMYSGVTCVHAPPIFIDCGHT